MARIRTFVAIEIPKPLRKKIERISRQIQPVTKAFKWVATDSLHLTLNFLGDIDEQKVNAACLAVARNAAKTEIYQIDISGIGAFPRIDRPRAIWAGIEHGTKETVELFNSTTLELEEEGFQIDARFEPHITMGRLKRGRLAESKLIEKLGEIADFEIGDFAVTSVGVFSSKLEKSGPIYVKLATCELNG